MEQEADIDVDIDSNNDEIVSQLLSIDDNKPQVCITPKPDQLKLIIITCKAHLNCNLNLELIAKKLPLDDQIIGKKLLGIIEEGLIKTRAKTLHKKNAKIKKKTSRKDFSNQCTIIVKIGTPPDEKKLNLKLFGNGKIVITGGLSKEDGKDAVDILKGKIIHLEDIYQISPHFQFSDYFENIAAYLKYISKNYLVFLKFFSIFDVNVDLRLDIILNKKYIEKFTENDLEKCDPVNCEFLKFMTPKDLDGYLRLIQIFNICHLYFPNNILLDQLNQPENSIHSIIRNLYQFRQETLPLTFDKEKFQNQYEVTIENYNTMFNCGFQNNREIFTQILNDKYKKIGLITSAKFEPSNYQGINVKYISRVLCHSDCTSEGKKKNNKCLCKEISFLIFQEGNIIITGGRSWNQLIDGYNVITDILKNDFQNIVVEKAKTTSQISDLPAQIIEQLSDGKKIIYINKKKQIIENPRNVYLLKKIGLLDKY